MGPTLDDENAVMAAAVPPTADLTSCWQSWRHPVPYHSMEPGNTARRAIATVRRPAPHQPDLHV